MSDKTGISYCRFGKTGGLPAFYFHGLPGSALEGELLHNACLNHGVDLVAAERFGYGETAPYSGQQSTDRYSAWAQAINQLADALGFNTFYLFAASGGGPYALACASLLGQRVIATGIAAGLGPIVNTALRRQMLPRARWAFYLALHHPLLLRASYGVTVSMAAKYFSHTAITLLGKMNSPADRAALAQQRTHQIMQRSFRRALTHGIQGAVDDLYAAQQAWPFSLDTIHKLHLWHGDNDRVVPISHSQWIRQQVADSQLHILPNEGHFSVPISHADKIVETLLT